MTAWEHVFLGNTVRTWLITVLVAFVCLIVLRILRTVFIHRFSALAEKTKTEIDDWVAELLRRTKFSLMTILAFYAGAQALTLPLGVSRWVHAIGLITLLIQVGIWANALVLLWLDRYQKREVGEDAARITTLRGATFLVRLVIYSIVALLALDNIPGVEVTTLVASLGIGGIAVALAVQSVLADLFASLSITLDKPFVIGDFIIVGDFLGTVEHIGLKTTRLRSLSGEQLIFSNNDLLNSRIRNYKRMQHRRVIFSIGVTYETPYDKLTKIPNMIRGIVKSQEKARFDRTHFKEYGDFALNIEVVYYVLERDYNVYMDTQQTINLAIFRRFEEEGIEFAYPTQTVYVGRAAGAAGESAGRELPES